MKKFYLTSLAMLVVLLASWATTSVVMQQDDVVDFTSKIKNPNLDDGLNGWTQVTASGQSLGVKAANTGNPVYTCYKGVFEFYQIIEDLPAGLYTLKVQAFSRPTSNASSVEMVAAGEEQENYCVIYANDVEVHAVALTSEWLTESGSGSWSSHTLNGQTIYLPNASDAFADAFKRGMYDNELDVIVGTDGKLKIGIKNTAETSSKGDTYTGFDNFRLYYNGPVSDITDEMVSALLATVPTGYMNAKVKADLDGAVAALKADKSTENYNAVVNAIADATASVTAYANIKAAFDKAEATALSAESKASYTAAVKDIKAAYDAKTIEGDGTTEVAAIEAALDAAIKADIANNKDKTGLIVNANFEDGKTGWSGNFGNGDKKGESSNYVITCYGGGFDVYQTIEGLTPGIYQLKVQAFTRPTSNDETWTAVQNGTALTNETYIYGNDSEKKVMFIVDEYLTTKSSVGTWSEYSIPDGTAYVPNNSNAFSIAFTAGLYDNEMYCLVGEDGKLKLGIKNLDTDNGTSYAGFDNFRLTYIGSCDFTDKIVDANLDDGLNGWTIDKSEGGSVGVKAADTGNPVYTCYNGVFDIHQTLTNLIPGTYKLQVQAFFRPCVNDELDALLKTGKELENFCYVYANDEEVQPVQLSSQSLASAGTGTWRSHTIDGKTVYLPDNSSAFADAFRRGMYDNELTCYVGEDGKLTIGIRNEKAEGSQGITYAGFDNFRLTYVSTVVKEMTSDDDTPETLEDLIARVETYNKIASQATDHAAFDAVFASATEVLKKEGATDDETATAVANVIGAFNALLKTGETETGQFDITALIKNPTFDKNADGWKMAGKSLKWNSIGVLQGTNVTGGEKLYQVLKGLPAGKYTLKVQGFYQAQAWKQALYDREHGKEVGRLLLLFNETAKPIKSIFDDARNTLATACVSRKEDVGAMVDGRGFPLMMDKVSDALSPGGYWTFVESEVTEDGDVTIGVSLEETDLPDNWIILDNFRLYYGERKPIVVKTGIPVTDDTPAEVMIVPSSPFEADTLIPFSSPCDIDGSKFKAVYEIGLLDDDVKVRKAVVFPVENVRAGVPCYVEFAQTTDTLRVERTVLKAEKPDTYQLNWNGGVVYPYYASVFNWRMTTLKKQTRAASYFTSIEIQDLDNLKITGNVENYQVRMFMNEKYTQSSSSVVSTYNAIVPARRDLPHAIGIPVPASKADGAVVKYGLSPDFSDARTIDVINAATVCYIPNLIPGNTYYFAVESGSQKVVKGELNVEGPVRMLYAPSVYNLRDLGGWTVQDGRTVRYGLIYRGGEVNGYHAPVFDDLKTLMDLGIGAEIDLRWRDDYDQDRETNKSGYGFVKGDTYYFAGANDYTAANLSEAATLKRFKEEFQFLMKHIRQGRAVHFHCVFGADRTGLLAVLLEGLLGMDLNSLYHDYEFTSFAAPAGNRNKSTIQERIAVIQKESGATLRDKFESFWLNKIGITADEIREFRDIMLVEPTTGIGEVELQERDASPLTIKSVYNANGIQVPQSVLDGGKGFYIIRYNNGSTKKVFVE